MGRRLYLISCIGIIGYMMGCHTIKKSEESTNSIPEPHRPLFHFTPLQGWMNDPNGLVYFEDEYHLFYQHYPDSTVWGPMHWGHAVSKDLVQWQHLPIALYPDTIGLIFSGSIVVDHQNSSGLSQDGKIPLVAIFTHHNIEAEKSGQVDYEKQSIAYSTDRGRTWTMYKSNPVLINLTGSKDFRDPKVFWYEPNKSWIMVTAVRDHISLWSSPDLKQWSFLSDFGADWGSHNGVWECPDLFPIQIEGSRDSAWVLLLSINPGGPNGGSATQYFIGDFNGQAFSLSEEFKTLVADDQAMWVDYGADNYAGVTWSGIPEQDGRRLFIGWMSNWTYAQIVPTKTWRSAMTLPRELKLHHTPQGLRMISIPIQELTSLRKDSITLKPQSFKDTLDITALYDLHDANVELELEFEINRMDAKMLEVLFSNDTGEVFMLGLDLQLNQYYMNRKKSSFNHFSNPFIESVHIAPRSLKSNFIKLHIFLDVASCELFADEGATIMTDIFFPSQPYHHIKIASPGSTTKLVQGTIYPLSTH